jgi:hypothetical protein
LAGFVIDSRERASILEREAIEKRLLRYGPENHSYDLHIFSRDGTQWRGERKDYVDFMGSRDKLARQLGAVDFLLVEGGHPEDIQRRALRVPAERRREWWRQYDASRKTLWHIQMMMPVITTHDEHESLEFIRYMIQKGQPAPLRESKPQGRTPRRALMASLPGINPERSTGGGFNVGDNLESIIQWDDLVGALNLDAWLNVRGIGDKTVMRIKESLLQAGVVK